MRMLEEVIDWFERVSNELNLIEGFSFGGEDVLVSFQRHDISYPVLILEIPELKRKVIEDELELTFKISFVVGAYTQKDDFEERKQNWLLSNQITSELVKKLYEDLAIPSLEFHSTPVSAYSHDNIYGYQTSFELVIFESICKDENSWN